MCLNILESHSCCFHKCEVIIGLYWFCHLFFSPLFKETESESDSRLSWIESRLFIRSTHSSDLLIPLKCMFEWKKKKLHFFRRLLCRNTAWKIQYVVQLFIFSFKANPYWRKKIKAFFLTYHLYLEFKVVEVRVKLFLEDNKMQI